MTGAPITPYYKKRGFFSTKKLVFPFFLNLKTIASREQRAPLTGNGLAVFLMPKEIPHGDLGPNRQNAAD